VSVVETRVRWAERTTSLSRDGHLLLVVV